MFYVRENIACHGGHFHVSAGERLGWKRGRLSKRHPQVLELAAPEYDWDRVAAFVHTMDALQRPVRKNRRFTGKWAEAVFKDAKQPGEKPGDFF